MYSVTLSPLGDGYEAKLVTEAGHVLAVATAASPMAALDALNEIMERNGTPGAAALVNVERGTVEKTTKNR